MPILTTKGNYSDAQMDSLDGSCCGTSDRHVIRAGGQTRAEIALRSPWRTTGGYRCCRWPRRSHSERHARQQMVRTCFLQPGKHESLQSDVDLLHLQGCRRTL